MKNTIKKPVEYFKRFDENPVELTPVDQSLSTIAEELVERVGILLKNLDVDIMHIGSTAYKIPGKGEIEIGIFTDDANWAKVKKRLEPLYGKPKFEVEERIRYNTQFKWKPIEILLMRGDTAKLNKAVHAFLLDNITALAGYEKIKEASKHSNREYLIAKNKFFEEIIEKLPEA